MTGKPSRIQLRRTRGWRKPEGAIVVARPTRWGNPYAVGRGRFGWTVWDDRRGERVGPVYDTKAEAAAVAVDKYRTFMEQHAAANNVRSLAGHDLACWCPLDQPCHADVLLDLANPPSPPPSS